MEQNGENMLESILSASNTTTISSTTAFLYTIAAGILGLCIALTYMKTGRVSKNFARTLIILPMLVCVVMLVVNGNLGTSVAIVGAFSLIRFRSLQGNSRDIGFVFFAMTAGLTCSVGYISFAFAVTLLICAVMFVLELIHFAGQRSEEKELKITIPEDLDYNHLFDDLFETYTKKCRQVKVKTTNMGSLYEITYRTELKDPELEKEMLDKIRCRNGNLTVICGQCNYDEEEL